LNGAQRLNDLNVLNFGLEGKGVKVRWRLAIFFHAVKESCLALFPNPFDASHYLT
jgi:hypothetical protein